ncbi:MAG: matrixin family metalloprotease [Candidatus Binatia bacterium]
MSIRASHFARITLFVSGLIGLLPAVARSTTFVLMDEHDLLRSSAAVVVGTVTGIESGTAGPDGAIYTYVHVQPERVIKGPTGLQPLVLREPGGLIGERSQVIFGSPEFRMGERTLLFLSRNPDGTLQTNSLAMGKYALRVDAAGHTAAVRDFGSGASMFVPSTGKLVEASRQTQRFLPLLKRLRQIAQAERHTGSPVERLTLVPEELASTPTRFQEAFTYLSNPPARWFQPDSGQPVTYLIDSTGDQTLGFASTRAAVDGALAAWSTVPTSSLILQDGGTTSPGPFSPCDINRLTFNDPYGEITDPSNCSGILAIGGYCSGGGSTVVNGTTFSQIVVGKVTFNNGWGGCAFWNQCNVAEVMTHELGHTIGLGHTSVSNATMYAYAHFDGRCASLAADDMAGVSAIYPQIGTPGPTRTATQTLTRTPTRTWTSTPTWTPTLVPTSSPIPTLTPTSVATRTSTLTPPPTSTGVRATPTSTQPPAPTATSGRGLVNDACGGAAVIATNAYVNAIDVSTATAALTDPIPQCNSAARGKSIWYRFTAPRNGTITANTSGSNYDTVLSTYTGSCTGFVPVPGGCNDNASWLTRQSRVTFTAVAGRTYYFMITATPSSYGNLSIFRFTFY